MKIKNNFYAALFSLNQSNFDVRVFIKQPQLVVVKNIKFSAYKHKKAEIMKIINHINQRK